MVRDARMTSARWTSAVLIACLLVLTGCSFPGAQETGTRETGAPPATSPTTVEPGPGSVEIEGRRATLYAPVSRPAGSPAALVVVLHGYTGEASGAIDFFGLRELADQRGFVILAPQGTTDPEGNTFWNAWESCCNFHGSGVDDSGYLSRLIAQVVSTQGLDPSRVYLAGHSNGGFMAHRFACDHPDQVAAVASLAGALDAAARCSPERTVSVLQVHGTADDTIYFKGGEIAGKPYTSAKQTAALWRRVDQCSSRPRADGRLDADAALAGDDLRQTTWAGCRDGAEVSLWTITGGNHVPALTPGFAGALFDWFEAHQRPR